MPSNLTYAQMKQERHKAQLAFLFACLDQYPEPHDFYLALLDKWPTRLPKVVARHLDKQNKKDWAVMKEVKRQAEVRALMNDDEAYLQWLAEEGLLEYPDQSVQLLNLIETLPNLVSISMVFTPPSEWITQDVEEQDTFTSVVHPPKHHGETFDFQDPQFQFQLLHVLGMGLKSAGALTLRQRTHLKVKRPNAQGVMAWQPQEKIYGLRFERGQITLMDEQAMKWAYNTDSETGKPLPMDPATSFGNLKALNKAKQIVP